MYTPPVATTDRTILRGIWTGIGPEGRPSGWFERRACRERDQAWSFRGSKSRNKVSVGEPAEGSLPLIRWPPIADNTNQKPFRRRVDGPPGFDMRARDAVFFPVCTGLRHKETAGRPIRERFVFPRGNTRFESRRVVFSGPPRLSSTLSRRLMRRTPLKSAMARG